MPTSAAKRAHAAPRAGPTREGPAPSLDEVYRTHARFVWRVAAQLLSRHSSSDVDDVVHDTFLVVRRRLPTFEAGRDLRSWLFGITRNVVRLHQRSSTRAKQRLALVSPPAGAPVDPERHAEQQRVVAAMDEFLGTLNTDQRVAFVLMEVEGLSAAEVATVVDAPINTVYSRLRLARRAFDRFARTWRRA